MTRTVYCVKLHTESEGLERPPYPGALGQRVYEQVSKAAWQLWLKHQTMLINEHRLSLADARSRKLLEAELEKFFFGAGSTPPSGYIPPSA